MALNPPVNLFRRTFSKAEWEQIEDFLIQEVNNISVPERVTPQDITKLNARLDELSAPVMWLYATTKRTYESVEMDRKNAEKQVYLIVKDMTDDQGNPTGKKKTEAEISAAIVEFLNTTPLKKPDGTPMPNSIYVMEKAAMERFMFMDAVVSTMKQKGEKLITDLGAIKLEVMVSPNGNIDEDDAPASRRTRSANS